MRQTATPTTSTTGPPRRSGHGSAWAGGLAREELLGVLSHELRTPVTTIYGGAHLLATRDLPEERRRAVASDVGQEAEHLYRIVEDLLVLLRTERGAIAPVGEPVAVGHLIVTAIEREIERSPGQQIRYLGSRDAAIDGVDEQLIVHVVRNLLANAVAESPDDRPVEIVVESCNDEIVVRFLDSGPLPTETQDDLDPSAGPSPKARGSLALFAAGRLIDAMHGHSWVRARACGGAEFGFALPGRPVGPDAGPGAGPLSHD